MQKEEIRERNLQYLYWLDPRSGKRLPAGVAHYNHKYGEYFLRIDEEASEKTYYLRPRDLTEGRATYRMDLIVKDRNGKFIRRQFVGDGWSDEGTEGNVYINYGSKYKALVLELAQ